MSDYVEVIGTLIILGFLGYVFIVKPFKGKGY